MGKETMEIVRIRYVPSMNCVGYTDNPQQLEVSMVIQRCSKCERIGYVRWLSDKGRLAESFVVHPEEDVDKLLPPLPEW